MKLRGAAQRKTDHIEISLKGEVEFKEVTTGLEEYRFIHCAVPEIDLDEVSLTARFLDWELRAPLMISSMVGGVKQAQRMNRHLAEAAQEAGIAMGLGSLRCAFEDPSCISSFDVRDVAPDIPLFANLGAVQLNYGYGPDECLRAVEMVRADALILHLNPLQEALQPEGTTRFGGLLKKIEAVCRSLPVPVIAKEVSFGISADSARRLADAGVSAIDVAGAGGTSWGEVEKQRSVCERDYRIADAFASWGIRTADAIRMVKQGAPGVPLIASGGIRTGHDVAVALALGADIVGMALPLLKAAAVSTEAVMREIEVILGVLRVIMFCTGTPTIEELKRTPHFMRTHRRRI